MISRLNKLFVVLFILGFALYIVILNRENLTFHLTPSSSITAPGGVVFIAIFCIGLVCAALVASFFGLKAYFRERGYLHRERQRESFFNDFLLARSLSASEEWGKARQLWDQIARRHPTNIVAHIELSRSLQRAGNAREALKVLDTARALDSQNAELLFRAAELNMALGNNTAAIDNLALVLYHHPVARAAALARNLSEELERFEDAIEYHKQYEKLKSSGAQDSDSDPIPRLRFKQCLKEHASDSASLLENLKNISRSFPDYAPPLQKLAELESSNGDIDASAQYLVKAAGISKSQRQRRELWREAMRLWTTSGMPDRALATARSACKNSSGEARLQAEVDLAQLYLALSMFDDAQRSISGFLQLAQDENCHIPSELSHQMLIFEGYCLQSLGRTQESLQVWKKLSDLQQRFDLPQEVRTALRYSAPSPTLSTP